MPVFILILALATAVPILCNVNWPHAWDARLFVVLAMAGHLGLAALLCCAPAWLLARLGMAPRGYLPLLVAMAGVWLLLVLVDARVFGLFGFHLNGLVLVLLLDGGLLQQLGLSAGSWALLALGGGLVVLVLAGLVWGVRRSQARWLRVAPRRLWWLLPLLVVSQGMSIWYDANHRGDGLAAASAVPWLPTATARRQMEALGLARIDRQDGTGRALQERAHAGPALDYPRKPLRCAPHQPMNVLLLVVDSLRHDMLTPELMPNVSRLAAQAWQGQHHYSTGNNTMHGMFGLFYGLPALHTNSMIQHQRGPELLRQLQQAGYSFHLYGGASLQGARMDRAVFVQTRAPLRTAPDNVPRDERDRYVVDRLEQDIAGAKPGQPFFAFALLDGVHAPYVVPADAEHRFMPQAAAGDHLKVGSKTDPTPLFNRYRNAVIHADALIGEVLQALERSGQAGNTVVVVTSDHGEAFNDLGQNDWGHNSNFSDTQVKVPMLVRWPGRAPVRESAVTSHMDLAPTLLRHLLDCRNPVQDYSTGDDLFASLPAFRPLLVESWTSRAVRLGPRTLVMRPYGLEARDAAYQPVQMLPLGAEVNAAIITQMQPLR